MTAAELALRIQHGDNPAAWAALDAHRIATGAAGLSCSCGWLVPFEKLSESYNSFGDLVLDHLEQQLREVP